MRDAVEVCRSGALGRIMAVEARMVTSQVRYRNPGHWLFRKDTAGTGILSWLGCHYLDLLCYFLDDRVVEVAALVGQQNPEEIEVEDTACLALRVLQRRARHAARGLSPDRERSRVLRRRLRHLHGLSRYGRLPASAARNGRFHRTQPRARLGGQGQTGPRLRTGAIASLLGGVSGEEFLREFLQASRAGAPGPAPIDAAVHVLEIIEAAIESLRHRPDGAYRLAMDALLTPRRPSPRPSPTGRSGGWIPACAGMTDMGPGGEA